MDHRPEPVHRRGGLDLDLQLKGLLPVKLYQLKGMLTPIGGKYTSIGPLLDHRPETVHRRGGLDLDLQLKVY